ncbi:MAG: hypothetical protein ACRD1T_02875 [Acidimicrobiia bacterium]
MTETWPHIGPRELRQLWDSYAPRFIRLDDVDYELPKVREQFLQWLVATGVDLGDQAAPTLSRSLPVGGRSLVGRIKLEEVGLARRDRSVEAAVTMTLAGDEATGTRKGAPDLESVLQLAACATLDAIHKLVPDFGFGLEGAFLESFNRDSLAISIVNEETPEVLPGLVGAAAVVTTPHEAVVRATLDAINRQMAISGSDTLR